MDRNDHDVPPSAAPVSDRLSYRFGKRVLDVSMASVLLAVTAPLLAALALLNRLSSPGGAFYRWEVVGLAGRPLVGYKLWTMVPQADRLDSLLLHRNEMTGPVMKIRHDPRVTPVG